MDNEKLQERISKLEMILYGIEQSNLNPHPKNQSISVDKLATAFSKAQGEYEAVSQNRSNPYFKSKYADLDSILKAVRPALVKHGLSFYQYESEYSAGILLHTRIMHSSGQWIEGQTRINPPKSDIQSYGSTMSYQRRYSALTILGIATSEDPVDDDGNRTQTISDRQLAELQKELSTKKALKPVILKKLNISNLYDMNKSDFDSIMNVVKKYEDKK